MLNVTIVSYLEKFQQENSFTASSKEEFYQFFKKESEQPGFVMAYWAGDDKTARAVVDGFAQGTIRLGDNLTNNIPFEQAPQAMQRVAEEDRSILGMVIDWRAHA